MLPKNLSDSRSQSLALATVLRDGGDFSVDTAQLYEAVVKILVLEYINEARFRTPIAKPQPKRATVLASESVKLPSYLIASLENRLKLITLKKTGTEYDEPTRRSLLRMYTELLDPATKAEITRIGQPEYLVMKFVSSANKEVVKLQSIPQEEISTVVFKQAEVFVQILISMIHKDKTSDAVIAKLKEQQQALQPKSTPVRSAPGSGDETFLKPSFRVSDMDQAMMGAVQSLFTVDSVKLQQDVFRLKDLATEKTLHQDLKQIEFYLGKDLGQFSRKSFLTEEAYAAWKAREAATIDALRAKYPVPSAAKLLETSPLPSGSDFYVLPPSHATRLYYIALSKMCLESLGLTVKPNSTLLQLCSKFWRLDPPTRVVSLYTAYHLLGVLKDNLSDPNKDLAPIDLDTTTAFFHQAKHLLEDNGLDWDDKHLWSVKDRDEWVRNLTYTYNQLFTSIKDCLGLVMNKTVKPRFGPYLAFLGDYVELDSLFPLVQETSLPKKWEKKLSKALLRISETRYAELLANLPRDDTLNVVHILDISDSIVADIKLLQKRYKQPLLGFLNVSRTVAAVITGMFALDSKNILKHINAYTKNRGEFIPYADAIEAYRSLSEIRFIHDQVSPGSSFKFDLEAFFFPFLSAWVDESSDKILSIIHQALENDKFEPIDIEDDNKKFSSSVLDIFTLVKEFLRILSNLNWKNEYQIAKTYTALLKSISDGVLVYANRVSDRIIKDLDEDDAKRLEAATDLEKRKSANWLDEVKSVVTNIQGGVKVPAEPYNFKPQTCIALNNLAAMMTQLSKLEDLVDPESISSTVARFDPQSQNKYTSHVFSIRLVKAENLRSSTSTSIHPYVTMIDTKARRTIGRTRTIEDSSHPDWDEEFELTIPANTSLTLSVTVWDEQRVGTHSICGRALLQLDPLRFKHDGLPQEIFLDLDTEGRVLVEVAVESERVDAIFALGRAHRALKRAQERIIKLIVEKFSRFIHFCFSRANLKAVCGGNGNIKPTQEQMDTAMMPLYNYLNMNLQVLAEFLTKDLLLKVMLAAWAVVVSSADQLLLPKLASAKTFMNLKLPTNSNWQSAVTSAMANVSLSMGFSGKQLTHNELETVFSWLNFLCFDFFHNDGNGPPVEDLKNEQYQSLLLLPVYYDQDVDSLKHEVERLSPAFIKSLRDRNNFDNASSGRARAGLIMRNKTIMANATNKARAQAAREVQAARTDPVAAQTSAEDIILRLLMVKDEKSYVARRLEQRERLAHSIATERLARAAAEGRFHR